MCNCRQCQRSRLCDEICAREDVEELRALVKNLLNNLIETEEELGMANVYINDLKARVATG